MTRPLLRPWFAVTLTALAAFAALSASAPAPAHDWPSPGGWPAPPRHVDVQAGGWSGMLWAGPHAGAPAAPDATDCRRAPVTFDLPASAGGRHGQVWPATPRLHADLGATADGAETAKSRVEAPAAAAAPGGADASGLPPPPARERDARPDRHERLDSQRRPADEPVTAGVIDDNADFGEYLAFRQRWPQIPRRDLRVDERVLLDVRDARGRAVPDAQVTVYAQGRPQPLWARTDAGGRAWLMPQADLPGQRFEVEVSKGDARTRVQWRRGQRDVLQVRLDGASPERARLDIVFAIDATGSMADEIDKLKRSMRAVADQIARLPSQPDLCFGLVAYRDRGDEFFVRGADLTHDLGAFQSVLARLRAGGGGDYPEAMNEALHTAVHRIGWRGEGTARIVILLADAPPHLDYGAPHYDHDLRAALARGIKVFGVGASGLDRRGELVMRQAAQFTGGRFVFLTYAERHDPASGPGRETTHDVRNYSVETLDRLLVRLVSEEMARWPEPHP